MTTIPSDRRASPVRDALIDLVVKRPSTSWCATCLAHELGVTRHVVGNAYVTVERVVGFHREYGHCAGCGRRRLVVWYDRLR